MQDRSRPPRRPPPPLDAAALDRLALRYVERFATTRGKLADYLRRKVRERGWEGPPVDPAAVAERMAESGYVDDLAFAEARARSMARRGLGASRIADALRHARVGSDEAAAATAEVADQALAAALRFARRRRIGPFAAGPADRATRDRQLGAMIRAGHPFALARRVVEGGPDDFGEEDALTRCERDDPC